MKPPRSASTFTESGPHWVPVKIPFVGSGPKGNGGGEKGWRRGVLSREQTPLALFDCCSNQCHPDHRDWYWSVKVGWVCVEVNGNWEKWRIQRKWTVWIWIPMWLNYDDMGHQLWHDFGNFLDTECWFWISPFIGICIVTYLKGGRKG